MNAAKVITAGCFSLATRNVAAAFYQQQKKILQTFHSSERGLSQWRWPYALHCSLWRTYQCPHEWVGHFQRNSKLQDKMHSWLCCQLWLSSSYSWKGSCKILYCNWVIQGSWREQKKVWKSDKLFCQLPRTCVNGYVGSKTLCHENVCLIQPAWHYKIKQVATKISMLKTHYTLLNGRAGKLS